MPLVRLPLIHLLSWNQVFNKSSLRFLKLIQEYSFMDSTFSDIIYFIDPNSFGPYWSIRQFKFDSNGYFKALQTFNVKNIVENEGNLAIG